MKISTIEIKNFRSIENLKFNPSAANAICGVNSAGKSNVIRAIRIAFLQDIDPEKLAENFSNTAGSTSKSKISLTFDKPTTAIAKILSIKKDEQFSYVMEFRKAGGWTRKINGNTLKDEDFLKLSEAILIVYVPAIRDISTDGLMPFKLSLMESLKKQKGASSLAQINRSVRQSISSKGQALLSGPNAIAKGWLGVKSLSVDASDIQIEKLLPSAGVNFVVNGKTLPLDKLGTGHQSAVVLKLYRELGAAVEKPVIYLFEEPDNHLHPTSIAIVAQELIECSRSNDSQVFLTTHSPYMLNHFDLSAVLSLKMSPERATIKSISDIKKDSRSLKIALDKYGMKPAEALVAKRVIVVEGVNDVTVVRSIISLQKNIEPEEQDMLIIPAGGKSNVADLCYFLNELGVDWLAVFDWDALLDTNVPVVRRGLTAEEKESFRDTAKDFIEFLNSSIDNKSKIHKQIESALRSIDSPDASSSFDKSVIGGFLKKLDRLDQKRIKELNGSISKRYHTIVNKNLNKDRIFVWSKDIESVVVPQSAVMDAGLFLKSKNKVNISSDPIVLNENVMASVKRLTFDAEILVGLIENLWEKGHYKQKEAVRAATFFTDSLI